VATELQGWGVLVSSPVSGSCTLLRRHYRHHHQRRHRFSTGSTVSQYLPVNSVRSSVMMSSRQASRSFCGGSRSRKRSDNKSAAGAAGAVAAARIEAHERGEEERVTLGRSRRLSMAFLCTQPTPLDRTSPHHTTDTPQTHAPRAHDTDSHTPHPTHAHTHRRARTRTHTYARTGTFKLCTRSRCINTTCPALRCTRSPTHTHTPGCPVR
jgi:hypothetical protein